MRTGSCRRSLLIRRWRTGRCRRLPAETGEPGPSASGGRDVARPSRRQRALGVPCVRAASLDRAVRALAGRGRCGVARGAAEVLGGAAAVGYRRRITGCVRRLVGDRSGCSDCGARGLRFAALRASPARRVTVPAQRCGRAPISCRRSSSSSSRPPSAGVVAVHIVVEFSRGAGVAGGARHRRRPHGERAVAARRRALVARSSWDGQRHGDDRQRALGLLPVLETGRRTSSPARRLDPFV